MCDILNELKRCFFLLRSLKNCQCTSTVLSAVIFAFIPLRHSCYTEVSCCVRSTRRKVCCHPASDYLCCQCTVIQCTVPVVRPVCDIIRNQILIDHLLPESKYVLRILIREIDLYICSVCAERCSACLPDHGQNQEDITGCIGNIVVIAKCANLLCCLIIFIPGLRRLCNACLFKGILIVEHNNRAIIQRKCIQGIIEMYIVPCCLYIICRIIACTKRGQICQLLCYCKIRNCKILKLCDIRESGACLQCVVNRAILLTCRTYIFKLYCDIRICLFKCRNRCFYRRVPGPYGDFCLVLLCHRGGSACKQKG